MAVTVQITVTPPPVEDIHSLHVFESANPTGPFAEVKVFTAPNLGNYPDWQTEFDVDTAISADDWFAVQWQDANGAWIAPLSPAMRGGNDSLVKVIAGRVLQRDRQIDSIIAQYEAEAAVEWFFDKNPYGVTIADIEDGRQYRVLNGLSYLALARAYIAMAATHGNVESASMGILSFRTQSGTRQQVDVQQLIDLANLNLNINTSLVMQLQDVYDTRLRWQQWFEDWQVNWDQLPWILGIHHWSLP